MVIHNQSFFVEKQPRICTQLVCSTLLVTFAAFGSAAIHAAQHSATHTTTRMLRGLSFAASKIMPRWWWCRPLFVLLLFDYGRVSST